MRRGDARAVVAMREHLESELRVLVEDFHSARGIVPAIRAHEVLVPEQALEPFAHLFASGRAGVARERGAAVGDELVEIVGHMGLPDRSACWAQFSRRFPLGARVAIRCACVNKGGGAASYAPNRRSLSSER